jgi:hypothetical protein
MLLVTYTGHAAELNDGSHILNKCITIYFFLWPSGLEHISIMFLVKLQGFLISVSYDVSDLKHVSTVTSFTT